MPEVRVNRTLPAQLSRQLIRALLKEIGDYTLRGMIQRAGISRWDEKLGWMDGAEGLRADEYARLLAQIREYYGTGARGLLNRVGRIAWGELIQDSDVRIWGKGWVGRLMPHQRGARLALETLAEQMRGLKGDVSVHLLDIDLYLIDSTSDATYEQKAEEPVCAPTVGLIQAALTWSTGMAYDVEEVACRATGAEACKFRVRL